MSRDTSVLISAITIAAWLVVYFGVLGATRRKKVKAGPATEQLREESPAVAGLLVNEWEPGPYLAEATVTDLAARKFLAFDTPVSGRTTVHIGPTYPTGLTGYEQQIFDRVSGAAKGGQIPVGQLDFHEVEGAVLAEAREAGLVVKRFEWRLLSWLLGGAALTAIAVGGSIYWATKNSSALVAGAMTLVALSGLVLAAQRDQHSPKGVEALRHWLGVRDFMRSHTSFSEQGPATIGKWERYMAYGVALGVSHTASQALGIAGEGDSPMWTIRGTTWQRVRVWYPRGWDRYGRHAPDLLRQAAMRLVAGVAVLLSANLFQGLWERVVVIAGVYFLLRAAYLVVITVIDILTQRAISGTVIWRGPWRRPLIKGEFYLWRVPRVDYLVIDDGRSDPVIAWALPAEVELGVGKKVRLMVRPWSRRVMGVISG